MDINGAKPATNAIIYVRAWFSIVIRVAHGAKSIHLQTDRSISRENQKSCNKRTLMASYEYEGLDCPGEKGDKGSISVCSGRMSLPNGGDYAIRIG